MWLEFLIWMSDPGISQFIFHLSVFAVSMVTLAKTSHWVVKSSVKISRLTKLGELVVGFIFLSITTTLPELAVSYSAIVSGNAGISIGNLLGSNITNLGLIMSIPAIMAPIKIKRGTFEKLPTILFLSSIIPLLFLAMEWTSELMAFFLIGAFVFFAAYSVKTKISLRIMHRDPKDAVNLFMQPFEVYKSVLTMILSAGVLIVSSVFVVDSASEIANTLGIAESVLGATIIAIGTSLPELSIALTAVKTKHNNMAIGNLLGSCLTNITLILGLVMLFSPVIVNIQVFSTLLLFVVAINMISWYFFTTGRVLDRNEGIVLMFVYILFLISTFGVQLSIL